MGRAVREQVGLFEAPETSGAEGTPRPDRLPEQLYGVKSRITGCYLAGDLTWGTVEYVNEHELGPWAVSSYIKAQRMARRYLGCKVVPHE